MVGCDNESPFPERVANDVIRKPRFLYYVRAIDTFRQYVDEMGNNRHVGHAKFGLTQNLTYT